MSTAVDDTIFVLDPIRDRYTGMDGIGRRVWDLLETPTRVDRLRDQLTLEYRGDHRQIAVDLIAFLNELTDEGLLEVQ